MTEQTFDPNALRRIRREKGVSQLALANAIGRKNTVVSQYECGRCLPSIGALANIAKALDARMEDFVTADVA